MSSFDTLDHAQLRALVKQRVCDGVLTRLIGKWLKAGVMEDGEIRYSQSGTPQGGVISPLLANIYLHYVIDKWFQEEVTPRMKGRVFMIRYADDMVLGFACEGDAQRVRAVLPKRLAKYGLTIHPEKTRVVPFGCPQPQDDDPDLGSFDFLGFTHHWGRSLKGNWVVKRKTACSRFRRAIRRIAQWCRLNRHQPVAEQHQALTIKLRGHYGYYGITGNGRSLKRFCNEVCHLWRKWLARRNRERSLSWIAYTRLLKRYPLPQPRVVHSVYRRTAKP